MNSPSGRSRERWSSWIAFVWVAAGAAVGLGNVWKFPYMAGSNGGSAFVLMYLIFVLIIALPVMAAEIMLGKLSRKNAVDGFRYLAVINGRSPRWRLVGYLGLMTLQLVFCFYSVVAGWSIAYMGLAASNSFSQKSASQVEQIWAQFLSEPLSLVLCALAFIFFTMSIVYFGVKKGIERACTLMMPALLAVLVALVFYSAWSGGFKEALIFLFSFEPQMLNAGTIIASMGHAFFTLAVGACAMFVYGSYLPAQASVMKSIVAIAVLDVAIALLAGLAIFPLVFQNNLSPGQGPGLMFVTLPIVFSQIPFGWFWGTLFFLLLFFAALTSSLSFAEPLVDLVLEKFSMDRRKSVLVVGAITAIGSIFCALSFNVLDQVKIFNRFNIFEFVADISTNIMLPLGGIAIAIFAGLIIKPADFFSAEQRYGSVVFSIWRILTLMVAPIAIVMVMINALLEM